MTRSVALAVVALFATPPAHAQAPASAHVAAAVPAGWRVVAPPVQESDAWRCADNAGAAWRVRLAADGRTPSFDPAPGDPTRYEQRVAVAGGALTGLDCGEWGGEVRWAPARGRSVRVAATNLRRFLTLRSGLYGFTGLAHLTLRTGRVVRFDRRGGRWRMMPALDLGVTPFAVTPLGADSVLVVAAGPSGGVLLVLDLEPPARVVRQTRVSLLPYPTSIARDRDGVVYVGARAVVVRLRPAPGGYTEDWLTPPACPSLQPVDSLGNEPCRCVRPRG